MISKCFRKGMVPGISMICAVVFLMSWILVNGFEGKAMAADNTSIDCYKEIVKTMVHGTAAGLGEALKNIKAEKDRIDLIRAFINPIRFYPDNSGYFYVYDFNCICIAHATQKELLGKNLYDYKEAKGDFVLRNLSNAAKNGGGFVEFYWVKPGSTDESKKLGYVETIPGTNYFIGSGVYLP
jgi:signal transduction histidine kinase